MRLFIAPLLLGTLVLAGASPAAAQSKPASNRGVSVGVAPIRDAAAERESYTQKAQADLRIWKQKLHDFDAKAQIKATEAQASAAKDLNEAWTETKTASARLETAGEKDWNSAQSIVQDGIRQTCRVLAQGQSRGQIGEICVSSELCRQAASFRETANRERLAT